MTSVTQKNISHNTYLETTEMRLSRIKKGGEPICLPAASTLRQTTIESSFNRTTVRKVQKQRVKAVKKRRVDDRDVSEKTPNEIIDHIVRNYKTDQPRVWQRNALIKIIDTVRNDKIDQCTCHKHLLECISEVHRNHFTAVCPAGGKTRFGIYATAILIYLGVISKVIIVSPNRQVQRQWADDFAKITGNKKQPKGILKPISVTKEKNFRNDSDGQSSTYQFVCLPKNHTNYNQLCVTEKTLVIFDECHHLTLYKDHKWGNTCRKAFENSTFQLLLSGTPYRSAKNERIPFTRAKLVKGEYHYEYDTTFDYEEGLRTGSHRMAIAYTLDGYIRFTDGKTIYNTKFENENLPKTLIQQRLRTATDIEDDNDFIRELLKNACYQLNYVRQERPFLQGLAIAKGIDQALLIKKFLEEIGEKPQIIYSDPKTPKTSPKRRGSPQRGGKNSPKRSKINDETIQFFKNNPLKDECKWIISISMLAEGTDIPNLTVMALCTTLTEIGPLTQILHRVTRKNPENGEFCYYFVPADKRQVSVLESLVEPTIQLLHQFGIPQTINASVCPELRGNQTPIINHDVENTAVPLQNRLFKALASEVTNISKLNIAAREEQTYSNSQAFSRAQKLVLAFPKLFDHIESAYTYAESTFNDDSILEKILHSFKHTPEWITIDLLRQIYDNTVKKHHENNSSANVTLNTKLPKVLTDDDMKKDLRDQINKYVKQHAKRLSNKSFIRDNAMTYGKLYNETWLHLGKKGQCKLENLTLDELDRYLNILPKVFTELQKRN